MSEIELSKTEERYLEDLKNLPKSVSSRLVAWALELVPSIGLFAYGMYAEKRLFVLFGFFSLLFFSVWRMYSQLRGFRMISRIYEARLAPTVDR